MPMLRLSALLIAFAFVSQVAHAEELQVKTFLLKDGTTITALHYFKYELDGKSAYSIKGTNGKTVTIDAASVSEISDEPMDPVALGKKGVEQVERAEAHKLLDQNKKVASIERDRIAAELQQRLLKDVLDLQFKLRDTKADYETKSKEYQKARDEQPALEAASQVAALGYQDLPLRDPSIYGNRPSQDAQDRSLAAASLLQKTEALIRVNRTIKEYGPELPKLKAQIEDLQVRLREAQQRMREKKSSAKVDEK